MDNSTTTHHTIDNQQWEEFCNSVGDNLSNVAMVATYKSGGTLRCACTGQFIGLTYLQDTSDEKRYREIYLIARFAKRFSEQDATMCDAAKAAIPPFRTSIDKTTTTEEACAVLGRLVSTTKNFPYQSNDTLSAFVAAMEEFQANPQTRIAPSHKQLVLNMKRVVTNSLREHVLSKIAHSLSEHGYRAKVRMNGLHLNAKYEIAFNP